MSVYSVSNDFIISSDTKLNAQNVPADGSRTTISFNPAIEIPSTAINPILTVESSEMYFSFVNIGASQGNNLLYAEDTTLVQSYTITIPDGLYSLSELDSTVERLFANEGLKSAEVLPAFEIHGDSATGEAIFVFNFLDVKVEMKADSPVEVLGFPIGVYPSTFPAPQAPYYEYGPVPAQFNQLNSILINSSLVSEGIRLNDKYQGTIAKIQINAPPGGQILYNPNRPSIIHIDNLKGASINEATFSITSEDGTPLDTAGETWSCTIRLSWQYKDDASSRSRHQRDVQFT